MQCIFLSLNQYGYPNIDAKFLGTMFVKRPQARLGSAFSANLDTLNSSRAHQPWWEPFSFTQAHSRYMSWYAQENSGYNTVARRICLKSTQTKQSQSKVN